MGIAEKGLYPKYTVIKNDNKTDPEADYFVLRLDKDHHARVAAQAYANSIKEENRTLSMELMFRVRQYVEKKKY